MTKAELSVPSLRGHSWKDAIGIWGGFVMAIFFAAMLSANPLGLLVRMLPAEQVTREFVVLEAKREGSKYKKTALELSLPPSPQFYAVDLAKRVFGEIPRIQPGDRVKFELLENRFGAYVTRFEVMPAASREPAPDAPEAGSGVGK
jgi:hypothetical protein